MIREDPTSPRTHDESGRRLAASHAPVPSVDTARSRYVCVAAAAAVLRSPWFREGPALTSHWFHCIHGTNVDPSSVRPSQTLPRMLCTWLPLEMRLRGCPRRGGSSDQPGGGDPQSAGGDPGSQGACRRDEARQWVFRRVSGLLVRPLTASGL